MKKICRSAISFRTAFIMTFLLVFSINCGKILADSDNVETDDISVEAKDETAIEEGLDFFDRFLEQQSDKPKGRNLSNEPVITPLTGKIIKLLFLNTDIVDAIITDKPIELDESEKFFESLTESKQIATFQEVEGKYIMTSLIVDENGSLSVDLDIVEAYIDKNRLNVDDIYYIRTQYRPDLTFVYSSENNQLIPFYKSLGNFERIDGMEHGEVYDAYELRDALVTLVNPNNSTDSLHESNDKVKEFGGILPMTEKYSVSQSDYIISICVGVLMMGMVVLGFHLVRKLG